MAVQVAGKPVKVVTRRFMTRRMSNTRQVWIPGSGLITVQRMALKQAPWGFLSNLIGQTERWVLPDGRHLQARRQRSDEWALCWGEVTEDPAIVMPQVDPTSV